MVSPKASDIRRQSTVHFGPYVLLVRLGGPDVISVTTMRQSPEAASLSLAGLEGPASVPVNLPSTASA